MAEGYGCKFLVYQNGVVKFCAREQNRGQSSIDGICGGRLFQMENELEGEICCRVETVFPSCGSVEDTKEAVQ